KEFYIDQYRDCLDHSDELFELKDQRISECYTLTSVESCDDYACSSLTKQFSCGDGHCRNLYQDVDNVDRYDRLCGNQHDVYYIRQTFTSSDNTDCTIYFICLFGINQYLQVDERTCDENDTLAQQCHDELFYFPSQPIVFGYVYFIFSRTRV
ncbi:unnamed protein product, partial [Didymodactylos carnosus]